MYSMYFLFQLFVIGLFLFPIVSLVLFVVSLIEYLRCPKSDPAERKAKRTSMIHKGILLVISSTILVALMTVFAMAIQHM